MQPEKFLFISSTIQIDRSELEWHFARSSGPGGQKVNKTSSKAVLSWAPMNSSALSNRQLELFLERYASRLSQDGKLVISCDETRSQSENVRICERKLRMLLLSGLERPKMRVPTRPSRQSKQDRLNEKKKRSQLKSLRKSVSPD